MNFSAVILAGGKSSRMGRDKAFLEIGGKTLLARQMGLARELGAVEIFISGRPDRDYSAFGCRVLQDKFADAGPLAGIEAALATAVSPLLLVLAVDLPGMSLKLLHRLGACCSDDVGAIPRLKGNIEPLAAFYPKAAQPLAETLLCDRQHAVTLFAMQCAQSGLVQFIELEAGAAHNFTNWNLPADLHCPT